MSEGLAMQRLEPFFSADTPAADNFPSVDQTDSHSVLWPVLLSVLVHGVLLLLFLMFATMPRTLEEPARKSVQIRIVPGMAPVTTAPATAQVEIAEVANPASASQVLVERAVEPVVDESIADTSLVEIPTSSESVAAADDESTPATVSVPIIDADITVAERDPETTPRPTLQLPSATGLRQLVKEISETEHAMSLADCNRLQQKNPLISCGASDGPDLPQPDRNFVYDYFNPRNEPRRSAASVNIIAAQTPAVHERMRSAGVNAALSDFLLYNQNVSDEDYRGTAPRAEKRLTDVLNMNDRTYQMIKKAMGE